MAKILEMLVEDDDIDEEQQQIKRIRCYKYLINPNNVRLNQFQLLLSIVGILDFTFSIHEQVITLTQFSLCFHGNEHNHMTSYYEVLAGFYLADIITHFIEMYETNSNLETNVWLIIKKYLFSFFIVDLISAWPYWLTFRVVRVFRMSTYIKKISDNVGELLGGILRLKKQLTLAITRLFKFFLTMAITVHIFASVFCGIGVEGWRVTKSHLIADPTNDNDVYIAGIYWIFLTFTTVGYGDISGFTDGEYLYTMGVELVGIVFFIYFMGNIYSILDDTQTLESIRIQQVDSLDLWIIQLGKAHSMWPLEQDYYQKIDKFMHNYWRSSLQTVQSHEFWSQLTPRLRKNLADRIFSGFYDNFKFFFEDCEKGFQRFIAIHCKYQKYERFVPAEINHLDPDFEMTNYSIIGAGEHATHVHFILSGRVLVSNKTGHYRYACLEKGSFFGEMYMIFNQESTYQYEYPNGESVETLSISRKKFKKALALFPASAQIVRERALDRRRKLREEKRMIFGSHMASKGSQLVQNQLKSSGNSIITKLTKTMMEKDIDKAVASHEHPLSPQSNVGSHFQYQQVDAYLEAIDTVNKSMHQTEQEVGTPKASLCPPADDVLSKRSKGKKKRPADVTLPSDFEIKLEKDRQKNLEINRKVQEVITSTKNEVQDEKKNAMKEEFQFNSEDSFEEDSSDDEITENEQFLLDKIDSYRKKLKEVYTFHLKNKEQYEKRVAIVKETVDKLKAYLFNDMGMYQRPRREIMF